MYLGNGSVGTQIIVRPDNTIIMEDFEIEKPGCGEVLIETVSTLISAGTELGTQEQKRTESFVPGYSNAGTIIANGPMGVFENHEFAIGTKEIFESISNNKGMTVVGGGETAMAFNQMGIAESIEHISTGGGSCIAFMADETMPVLEAMRRSKNKYRK